MGDVMANKKIVVLKLRELIYTGIFLFFGVLLVLLLVAMFSGKKSKNQKEDTNSSRQESRQDDSSDDSDTTGSSTQASTAVSSSDSATVGNSVTVFCPGVYTADFSLGGNTLTLQLLVDADRVKAVNLLSLDASADGRSGEEYIATMYPLMQPALEVIESSLTEGTALSDITFSVENQYTGTLLVQAIEELLKKAQLPAD